MMYHRIVVPVDSSALSRRALTHALDFAQITGAKLTVLYVNQIIPLYYGGSLGPGRQYIPFEKLNAEESLNAMLAEMDIQSKSIKKRCATGSPVSLIVKAATEEKANLIVMGSGGFGLLTGFFMGSVSQSVIKHAPCPALIVK